MTWRGPREARANWKRPGHAVAWTPKGGLLVAPAGAPIVPPPRTGWSLARSLPARGRRRLSLSADGPNLFVAGGQPGEAHWDMEKNRSCGRRRRRIAAESHLARESADDRRAGAFHDHRAYGTRATGKPAGTLDGHTRHGDGRRPLGRDRQGVGYRRRPTRRPASGRFRQARPNRKLAGHDAEHVTAVAVAGRRPDRDRVGRQDGPRLAGDRRPADAHIGRAQGGNLRPSRGPTTIARWPPGRTSGT